jgi:hypothetical protein
MTTRDDTFDIVRHSTKWNFVRSNVIPSNVTVTSRLAVGATTTSRSELCGSALRPAINPAAWYESPDRSKPSVSSF